MSFLRQYRKMLGGNQGQATMRENRMAQAWGGLDGD